MLRSTTRNRSNSVQSRTEARRRAGRAAIGCAVESLEGRQLFSVLTVNTTADTNASDGQLSLREAIALIQNGGDDNAALTRPLDVGEAAQVDTSTPYGTNDTIVFDSSIGGGTIVVGSQINVSGTMVIDGGSAGMTLSGGVSPASWRALYVGSTGDLTLNKLTVTNFGEHGSDGVFAPGGDAAGGAIYVDQGTLTVTNSTLSDNAAAGGMGDFGDGDPGGNGQGGAIFVSHGTLTVTGSTLTNNTAAGGSGFGSGTGFGGAICAVDANVAINFSTLSGNDASDGGRGLYVFNSGAATVEIDNSILGQADASVTDLDFNGPFSMSGSNNLIRNINGVLASADPRLAAFGDYGGGVQTFALLPDSPALDAAGAAGGVTTDARGTGRDYNGTSDVGAFESQGYTLTLDSSSTPQSVGVGNAFGNPLGVTLTENGFGAAIPGATIFFTAPSSGASATVATTATTDSGGDAAVTATANNVAGSYAVIASFSPTPGGPQDADFALSNTAPPAISSANSVTFTAGSAGTFTVTTTGFPVATLSNSDSLPSGVTFVDNGDGTATLSGTPAGLTGGTYTLTFTASNGILPHATQSFTLTVDEDPAITSANSATITAGSPGTFAVTTAGFPAGVLTETGSLPSGVTFTDNGDGTGTFAGTAVAGTGGAYTVTLNADNGIGSIASQTFTLTVDEAPSITSANNVTFTAGTAGSFTITTAGFPIAMLSEGGPLPSGITFTDNGDGTATLSGTAIAPNAGTYTRTITATNGISPDATQSFILTIAVAPSITSANNATFTAGTAGTFTITTGGFPVGTLVNSGTLPTGVVFTDNGDGTATLSGTPSGISGGTYSLTFTASNGISPDATQTFALTVEQAPSITSANSAAMIAGTAGSFTITAAEFPAGTLTKTGSLPSGVNFVDNGDGTATLAGTPALGSGGVYTLTISADNGVGSIASQTFTLFVGQLPSITSADHVTFTVGVAGTFTVATAGFPAPMLSNTGTLPAGVTFHDNGDGTATLSGTPTGAAASYPLGITADNGSMVLASQSFTLTVDPAPTSGVTGTAPTITSPATVNLVTGQVTTFTIAATGSPIPTLSVTGTLPPGLTFTDNSDGTWTVSGTVTVAGNYAVSVVADNGVGTAATQTLTLNVIPSHPVVVATGHAGGTVQVNNPDGSTRYTIKNPFKKGVGSRLASADVNGDGVADIIMAAGAGGQPQVLVYDGATGAKLAGFLAFAKSFTGGLFVAAADVDGDGTPDVVVGQGLGGTSKVRVFSGKDQSLVAEFNPIGVRNAAGVRVAAADLNGDGYAEVVAAQGSGDGRAVVKVLDGRALTRGNVKNLVTLSRADLGFAGGAYVATGDVNGDGTPDVVVSQSTGNRPTVATFNGKKVAAGKNLGGALISKFNTASDNGARIASYDFNQDGFDDIITSATSGTTAVVKIFSGADGSVLDTIENDQAGQVFVA